MKWDGAIWLFHPTGNSLSATQLYSNDALPDAFPTELNLVAPRNPLLVMYASDTTSTPNVPSIVDVADTLVVVTVGVSLMVSLN